MVLPPVPLQATRQQASSDTAASSTDARRRDVRIIDDSPSALGAEGTRTGRWSAIVFAQVWRGAVQVRSFAVDAPRRGQRGVAGRDVQQVHGLRLGVVEELGVVLDGHGEAAM